jgi:RNA polymerase sigma factor (sigma-70 family)
MIKTDVTNKYINEIKQLTPNDLITNNLFLVVKIAGEMQMGYSNLDDLIQVGNEGLVKAANSFDVSKGHKFSTYAYTIIRRAIISFKYDNSGTIRVPSSYQQATFFEDKYYTDSVKYDHSEGGLVEIEIPSYDEAHQAFQDDEDAYNLTLINEVINTLKPRPQEIIRRVMNGETLKVCATNMGIDYEACRKAYKTNIKKIQDKLGVNSL